MLNVSFFPFLKTNYFVYLCLNQTVRKSAKEPTKG
jgi:hypothetical protein